jgi:hypothetical protein
MAATTECVTPWHARAVELEPSGGPYCEFAAWHEWMEEHVGEFRECWESIDLIDRVFLFSLFEKAAEPSTVGATK